MKRRLLAGLLCLALLSVLPGISGTGEEFFHVLLSASAAEDAGAAADEAGALLQAASARIIAAHSARARIFFMNILSLCFKILDSAGMRLL